MTLENRPVFFSTNDTATSESVMYWTGGVSIAIEGGRCFVVPLVTQDSTYPGADFRTSVGEIRDTTRPQRLLISENGGEGAEACGRLVERFPNVHHLTAEQSSLENRSGVCLDIFFDLRCCLASVFGAKI